ncbi:MAG: ATP-binding protein [Desulfobulbaceae bacterium]|nr:ATP-binding protein [Desulfobulbaceae bacterium]
MPDHLYTYLLYLIYGMVFFAMGVAITSRDTRTSNLSVARWLWLFGLFAYVHAFNEWFELFLIFHEHSFPAGIPPLAEFTKLALLFSSFGFLLLFGMKVFCVIFPGKYHQLCLIPLFFVSIWLLSMIVTQSEWTPSFFRAIDFRIRNFMGFPAALISGLGFIIYSGTIRHISDKGSRNFSGAGFFLVGYGVLTGLVPSGTILPLLDIPVELARGVFAFAVLHFIMNALNIFDVERNLLIEERLHRFAKSEKLHSLGKLAFGIAHEINNPLTNVSLNVELLKKDLVNSNNPAFPAKRFDAIERNLDRATKIARELLSFASQNESNFQATDINDVIAGTMDLLGARRNAYRITRNLNEVPSISAIPWKLEEVFLNVIINAMDAMPEGGALTITTKRKGDKVVAEITDTGHGISPNHLDKVLDPFFTTKEVGKGTGLGLSICFAIMESHGGKIELDSHVDKGTTVSLIFPIGVQNNE